MKKLIVFAALAAVILAATPVSGQNLKIVRTGDVTRADGTREYVTAETTLTVCRLSRMFAGVPAFSSNKKNSCIWSFNPYMINLLKTKRNLLCIRYQSVPRSKRFPPWLLKEIS